MFIQIFAIAGLFNILQCDRPFRAHAIKDMSFCSDQRKRLANSIPKD